MVVKQLPPRGLHARHAKLRKRHPKQIEYLKRSIQENGFLEPVLIKDGRVVHGELRVAAAIELGLNSVPVIEVDHLTTQQARAYAIAANRIGQLAEFDEEALAIELGELITYDIELDYLGFEPPELDRLLRNFELDSDDTENDVPDVDPSFPIACVGDLFLLGDHRLLCGDALLASSYETVLSSELAELIVSDPPYNDKVSDISGNGRTQHREFVQASGEMSPAEFTRFITTFMRLLSSNSVDGSLHYLFMCWRQLLQLLRAGSIVYDELKAIVTWDKGVGGLGSLYRSQTEFVGVFKSGKQPHRNNIMLGKYGRNRTNLWRVDGMVGFSSEREELLKLHPTCKPVDLIADILLDASSPKGLVLDCFIGSGTLFLAAEKTGRRAAGLELDPLYVDVALRRFRSVTGIDPIHVASERTLTELEEEAEENLTDRKENDR